MKYWRAILLLAALSAGSTEARTAAPPPARAVPASFYSGVWYEIARTPNARQRHCAFASSAFEAVSAGSFSLEQTCRRGSGTGPAKVSRARGSILPGTSNERFSIGFLGGLIHQEFWVLDYAGNGDWAIMATPGGNYVWLLSRRRDLPASVLAAAVNRLRALGYTRLEFPAGATPP